MTNGKAKALTIETGGAGGASAGGHVGNAPAHPEPDAEDDSAASGSASGNSSGDPTGPGGENTSGDPDSGMRACTDGESHQVACGVAGRGEQTRRCIAGAGQDEGDCNDPDRCFDGESGTRTCGLEDLGIQDQHCEDSQWEDVGECLLHRGHMTDLPDEATPVAALGIDDAITLSASAGYSHTCAVRENGQVVCWGLGGSGQLGNGDNQDRSTPTAVSGLTHAVSVAPGVATFARFRAAAA